MTKRDRRLRQEVLVVSHTHWDREWHQPFQVFRAGLVHVVDDLLDLLESDATFRAFTLDGQTVVLEDYLAIRPEGEQRLRKLVQAGRLLVGPWYVQPDEFLVGGEALIRNLLTGRQVAERFGAPMLVGYCPDTFGHISQLPQILRGFGIDGVVLSRGIGDEGEALGSEFVWESPDGSSVLAIHQIGGALDRFSGYLNAALLGYSPLWAEHQAGGPRLGLAAEHAQELIGILRRYARTPYLLFNNGGDHLPPQRELSAILAHLNAKLPGFSFRQSTFSEYLQLTRPLASHLARWRGELRGARYNHILSGVLSTRIKVKLANARQQVLLERWAEPLCAIAHAIGAADLTRLQPFVALAWKLLLQNHAHDSICGCSIDDVYADVRQRFDHSKQLASYVVETELGWLASHASTQDLPRGQPILVFNPTAMVRSDLITGQLRLSPDLLQPPLAIVAPDGGLSPCQILGLETDPLGEPAAHVAVAPPAIAGIGYQTFSLRSEDAAFGAQHRAVRVSTEPEVAIESERYRIEAHANGTLRIVHRDTGHTLDGIHLVVDEADAGDEYTYAPRSEDQTIASSHFPAQISLLHEGPVLATIVIDQELLLPAALNADRQRRSAKVVATPVRTEVDLAAGGRWIGFRTTVTNQAHDHRLRVAFPTFIETETVEVLGHFDRLSRPVSPPPHPAWREDPGSANHQNGYVAVHGERVGVGVFSPELPEYLAASGQHGVELSLTLMRCVGWLSRCDLPTRSGAAGPQLATPGAQCRGTFSFRYALAIVDQAERNELPAWLEAYRAPMRLLQAARQNGSLPSRLAFLTTEGDAILTACKIAEDGEGLVARLHNPRDCTADVELHSFWPVRAAWLATLDETLIAPLAVQKRHEVSLSVQARSIVTVRLALDSRRNERRSAVYHS